jgi:rubrerythrin
VSEETPSVPQTGVPIPTELKQLAALLRQAAHLEPETQKSLASLLEELGVELGSTVSTSANQSNLTTAISEVARSLHEQHPSGLVEAARDRLKNAAAVAESEAPVATGVVYRFIEVLSDLGI